jgi:hypothetical protein
LALDRRRPVVQLGDLPHERQSQSGARNVGACGARHAIELLEDLGEKLRRDAAALIDDFYQHGRTVGAGVDRDGGIDGAEFDGVVDQVGHGAGDQVRVAQDRRQVRGEITNYFDPGAFGHRIEQQ